MAMVDTVYWLPIGGPAAPADWLGPKVGAATWRRFCIHHMNRVNSRNGSSMMTAL